jgi:hypothetical protein
MKEVSGCVVGGFVKHPFCSLVVSKKDMFKKAILVEKVNTVL